MNGFKKLSRVGVGRAAHHHVIYLSEDTNTGQCTLNSNYSDNYSHKHAVTWIAPVAPVPPTPPTPPQMDPNTGQMMPGNPGSPGQEGQDGYWQVEEAEGHTHEIEEYEKRVRKDVVKDPSAENEAQKTKPTDTEIVSEVIRQYRGCAQWEADAIARGHESYGFYHGKGQWTDEQREDLKKQDRACLTINEIAPAIRTLLSYQMEQRTDWKFRPVEGGDQRVGELADIVVKNITYKCGYDREETRAFKDAVIPGRGVLNISYDTSRSLRGDIFIDRLKWDDVLFGPHEREDADDCEVVCNIKWYSLERLKSEWGKKAKDIQRDWDSLSDGTGTHTTYADDQYKHAKKDATLSPDIINLDKKELKLIECWRKYWKESTVVTYIPDEYVENITGWDEEDIKVLNTLDGASVVTKSLGYVRRTSVAGSTLLEDESPADIPPVEGRQDYFPFVPIYCEKDDRDWWGIVEIAKDPQRELNKRHSQTIDIVNKVATYGHFYDEQTFLEPADKERWLKNSAKPGFNQKVADANRPPKQTEGVKFPSELVQLVQLSSQKITSLLNVVAQPYGANESGSALLQKQKLKLAGNEFLFENLTNARRREAKIILAYVQKYYTPERIYRLIQNSADVDKARIGGRPAAEYSEEEINRLLENQDLTSLDLVIDETQWSPTIRLANSLIMTEMAKNGMVPPEVPIEMNDTIPRSVKDKVIQAINDQKAAAKAEADQKMKMEIGKTLIAKNGNQQASGQEAPAPQQTPQQAPPLAMDAAMPQPQVVPQVEPGAPCPVCGEIAQEPMMGMGGMPQMMTPPTPPTNVTVNMIVQDRGKRVFSMGPRLEDGSVNGMIAPEPDPSALPPEMLAPMMQELNQL